VSRINLSSAVFVLALSFSGVDALSAHHGLAGFNQKKSVLLKGTLTKLDWVNPHAWLHIDATNPDGTITHWMVLCDPPGFLSRLGLTRSSFEVGMELTVEGFQANDSANNVDATTLTFKDGRRYFVRGGHFVPDGSLIFLIRKDAAQISSRSANKLLFTKEAF
jgi:Family of unknown function (DUF6152)